MYTGQKVSDFLYGAHQKGVNIWVEEGQLLYRGPHAALTSDDISVLRERRDEIVDLLGGSRSLAEVLAGPGPRRPFAPVPLSFQQEYLWNRRQTLELVLAVTLKLSGALDVGVLRSCLTTLVRRHESLRTRITQVDGLLTQRIDDPAECALELEDLSRLSRFSATNEAQRLLQSLLTQRVNLDNDPLFRATLLRISASEHVLAFVIHHAITDGTSIALMLRELWTVYKDRVTESQDSLPQVPLQYGDYAIWQRKTYPYWQLKNASYWNAQLPRLRPVEFPIDAVGGDVEPNSAAPLRISFGRTLSPLLHNLAKSQQTIPAMVMFTIAFIALGQWWRQRYLWIASVFSGRHLRNCENVLGFLVHGFYIQVELSEQQTFAELLQRVIHEFRAASEHLECGLAGENLQPPDLSRAALVQWISFDPFAADPVRLRLRRRDSDTNLVVESFPARGPAGFYGKALAALEVIFTSDQEGIHAHGYYRADLFATSTMRNFLRDLRRISEQVVRDPHVRVMSLI